jgi:vacuolar-type H+-ATPase subunit E/Vma4
VALHDLLAAIEQEGAAAAERTLQDARSEAARIIDHAEAEAEKQRTDYLTTQRATLDAEMQVAIASVRRRFMEAVLTRRCTLLDRVFAVAEEQLAETIESPAYRERIADHLAEAAAFLDGDAVTVQCPPAIARAVRNAAAKYPNVRVAPTASAVPGIVLSSSDGAVTVDNSLPARIRRSRARLSIEILRQVRERCNGTGET